MIVVAIIGILAAIAIPQYQHYVGRSNVAAAVQTLAANKTGIESFVMENGAFPDGTTPAVAANGTTAATPGQTPAALGIVNPTFGTIALQKGTGGSGNIVLTFTTGNLGINDNKVQWHRDADGTWTYKETLTAAT